MKDERIREIADEGLRMIAGGTEEFFAFTSAIQTALAERDREIEVWVKNNAQTYTHNREYGCVSTGDLLAFLEAQP